MQLRNKKTGEIIDLTTKRLNINSGNKNYGFNSLAELNEEWEDAEEPKDTDYWYIDDFGRVQFSSEILDEVEEHPNNWMARKLFGNYFGTREEAEKAVEKIKAWKRLNDKGVSFETKVIDGKWYLAPKAEPQQRSFAEAHDLFKDVMIVFGC